LKIDPDVKAIVSSGYSNAPVMANYSDYGFRAVLSKPYRSQEMSRVLYELLGNHCKIVTEVPVEIEGTRFCS